MCEWFDIKGYEGLYKINECGQILVLERTGVKIGKGTKTVPEHTKKVTRNKNGYFAVDLYKDTKRKRHYLHRLLAETFIPNPNNLPYINHKDENPSNNSLDNLEWCSSKYNNNYGTKNLRMVATRRANGTYIMSDATKQKISDKLKGRKGKPHSEQTKLKLRQINLGRHHTAETREKIRNASLLMWKKRKENL